MDRERFRGKNALVVGGSTAKGIGRSTALRFLQEGMDRVFLVADRPEELEARVREMSELGKGRVIPIVADVAISEDCRRVVDTTIQMDGHLDILVNNVAAWTEESFLEMKEESWDRVVGVILKSSFLLGQGAASVMKDKGGVILYTSSISALGASRFFCHYGAAKAGLNNLVRNMAIELAPYGIRVNSVCPGPLDTQQSVDICGEETMKKFRDHFPLVPLGERLGEPNEIAAAFAFLASDDASYITGQNLVVDGGLTAHAYSLPGPE